MQFLSKKDEQELCKLLSNSEWIIEDIFANVIDINVKKDEVLDALKKQRLEILNEMEKCPSIISKASQSFSYFKDYGFCFDANMLLSKLVNICATGTTFGKKIDYNELEEIGRLYYYNHIKEYKEEIIKIFKKIKISITNLINGENVIILHFTEEDKQRLLEHRRVATWVIHNIDTFIKTYTRPISQEIISCLDQDKILLLLAHIAISRIGEFASHEKYSDFDCIRYIKSYIAYIEYRKKLDKKYNPIYSYYYSEGSKTTVSANNIIKYVQDRFKNRKEFQDGISIKEEELLNILTDLNKEIKIREFRKDIELSWEFLPEKDESEQIGKRASIFKVSKPEEEKKQLEDTKEQLLEQKIQLFASLPYITSLKGTNRFEGYIAYLFENGRVILEKFYKKTKHGLEPTYNEAIYVMDITDFKELSKMGKTEIREYSKEKGLNVKVINHTKNFKQRVINETTSTYYNENVLEFIEELVSSAKKIEALKK